MRKVTENEFRNIENITNWFIEWRNDEAINAVKMESVGETINYEHQVVYCRRQHLAAQLFYCNQNITEEAQNVVYEENLNSMFIP